MGIRIWKLRVSRFLVTSAYKAFLRAPKEPYLSTFNEKILQCPERFSQYEML